MFPCSNLGIGIAGDASEGLAVCVSITGGVEV